MTHLLLNQVPSLGRSTQPWRRSIPLYTTFLDKGTNVPLAIVGSGSQSLVDKYHNLSYQKTIIIIIFRARSAAWPPLSVHQVKTLFHSLVL